MSPRSRECARPRSTTTSTPATHLSEEVMWWGLADLRRHVREVLDTATPGDTGMDRIMLAVEAHLRRELEVSDYTTASIRNTAQIPTHLRIRATQEAEEYGRIWHRLIEDAAREGEIRSTSIFRPAYVAARFPELGRRMAPPDLIPVDAVVTSAQMLIRQALDSTPWFSEPPPRSDNVGQMATTASRDAYLRVGLDILASDGYGALKQSEVCRRMGVTTGSFYHFFRNWADYTRALPDYWFTTHTQQHLEAPRRA